MTKAAVKADESGQDPKTGHFLPGNKVGVGKGRRPKPKTMLKRMLTEADEEALLRDAIQKAKDGNDQWAGFLLQRIIPPLKATAPKLNLNIDFTGSDSTTAMREVMDAVARGEVSSDQAKDLLQSIAAIEQVAKLEALEARLEALEGNHES